VCSSDPFNVDFGNSKAGKFSVFGIGGLSSIDFLGADIDTTDLFANPNENAYNVSKFGVIGVKHNLLLNDHSYIRTVLSASHSGNSYETEDLEMTDVRGGLLQTNDVLDVSNTYRLSSYYNDKISRRFTLRTGILLQSQNLDTYVKTRDGIPDFDGDGLPDLFTQRDFGACGGSGRGGRQNFTAVASIRGGGDFPKRRHAGQQTRVD